MSTRPSSASSSTGSRKEGRRRVRSTGEREQRQSFSSNRGHGSGSAGVKTVKVAPARNSFNGRPGNFSTAKGSSASSRHQYATLEAEVEARRRARQRWKKVKHGVMAQQAFSQAGKDARERRLRAEQDSAVGDVESAAATSARNRKNAKIAPQGLLGGIGAGSGGAGSSAGGRGHRAHSEREREEELVRAAKQRLAKAQTSRRTTVGRSFSTLGKTGWGNSSNVTDHILVGNREAAQDSVKLQDLGVTHVLNICSQLPNYHPNKFIYCKVDILDDPSVPISNYQKKSSKFLAHVEELGGRALVHCVAGCSRSVSIVILHLMAHHNIVLRDAWAHLKQVRPQMNPNTGFKLQLAKFEMERFGSSSMVTYNDKLWDFYEWNAMKSSLPRMQLEPPRQSGGCIIL